MISSSETHRPSSSEASSPTTECQPQARWNLPNGESLAVAQIDRLQHHPVSTAGVDRVVVAKRDPTQYEVLFSVDPGEKNVGVCMLIRDHTRPKTLRLEIAAQLEFDDCNLAHVVTGVYKYFNMWMDQWNSFSLRPGVLMRLHRAVIVVEQQFGFNHKMMHFRDMLETAILVDKSKYEFRLLTIAPSSVAKYHGLPSQKTHRARKEVTKRCVENGMGGVTLPRHDIADAIALATAALGMNKAKVSLCPVEIGDTSSMFVQPEEEPGEEISLTIDCQTGELVTDDVQERDIEAGIEAWAEEVGEGDGEGEGSAGGSLTDEEERLDRTLAALKEWEPATHFFL